MEPAFRPADQHRGRPHEPLAHCDRQGPREAAHSHRAGRRLCSEGMRLSSSRLAFAFVLIFAGGVSVLLAAVYFLTARVLDREVDAVISSEAAALIDGYARGGLLTLVTDLQRRADGWGRSGAVYLLVEPNAFPLAGNLARLPA